MLPSVPGYANTHLDVGTEPNADTGTILRGDSCTDTNVSAIADINIGDRGTDANVNAIGDINLGDRGTDARQELGRGWLQCTQ